MLTLSSYLDGELGAHSAGEVEAHLVGCRRCSTGIAHLQRESAHIAALPQVVVSDPSVAALLVDLGVLGADAELPPRRHDPPDPSGPPAAGGSPPPQSTPPWLTGRIGPALPWRADIPGRSTRPRSEAGNRTEASSDITIELSGHPARESITDPATEAPA